MIVINLRKERMRRKTLLRLHRPQQIAQQKPKLMKMAIGITTMDLATAMAGGPSTRETISKIKIGERKAEKRATMALTSPTLLRTTQNIVKEWTGCWV